LSQLPIQLSLIGGEVVERAGLDELVDRGRARLHLVGLVLGTLNRESGVLHRAADPRRGLADSHLSLGGRVLGLDHFLLRAELLHPRGELLLGGDELLLLLLERLHLPVEVLELLLDAGFPLERLTGEILPARRQRLTRLAVELDQVLLQLLRLELQPLLGRDDVGDAPLDVLQALQLALVGVVERFARILGSPQERREFRLDDHGSSGHQAGHSSSSSVIGLA